MALRSPAAASLEELATRAAELDRAVARQVDAASALEAQALSIEQQLAEASGAFAATGRGRAPGGTRRSRRGVGAPARRAYAEPEPGSEHAGEAGLGVRARRSRRRRHRRSHDRRGRSRHDARAAPRAAGDARAAAPRTPTPTAPRLWPIARRSTTSTSGCGQTRASRPAREEGSAFPRCVRGSRSTRRSSRRLPRYARRSSTPRRRHGSSRQRATSSRQRLRRSKRRRLRRRPQRRRPKRASRARW